MVFSKEDGIYAVEILIRMNEHFELGCTVRGETHVYYRSV